MNLFRRYTVLVEKKRYYCGLAVVLCLCAVSAFYWKEHSQSENGNRRGSFSASRARGGGWKQTELCIFWRSARTF